MGGLSGRYAESVGGGGGLEGRSNFYNSKRNNGWDGEDTPFGGVKTDAGFGTPTLHNFRNNAKRDEAESMKKYSQTPNPGHEDKHRHISTMADHTKKTALKTNSNAFYQHPEEGAGFKEDKFQGGGYKEPSNRQRPDNYYNNDNVGGSPQSYPSPVQRSNQTPTGRQFGKQ